MATVAEAGYRVVAPFLRGYPPPRSSPAATTNAPPWRSTSSA